MQKQLTVILVICLVVITTVGANGLGIRMDISNGNVYDQETVTIGGTLSKVKGEISEITIKTGAKKTAVPITLDENNKFSVEITLKKGKNKVTFIAKDDVEEKATREYEISMNPSLAIKLVSSQIFGAHDLAFDKKGNCYLSTANSQGQRQGGSVYKLSTDGSVQEILAPYSQTKEGDKMVYIDAFRGIEVDKNGTVYVLNETQASVLKLDGKGGKEVLTDQIYGANGLVIDSKGNLIVTSATKSTVYKLNPETKELSVLAENDPNIVEPTDIVLYKGTLYITSRKIHKIVKLPENGGTSTIVGNEETQGILKRTYPSALTVDSKGNLYVCQTQRRTILKIDTKGKASIVAKRSNWSDQNMWKDPVGIEFGNDTFGKDSLFVCFKTNLPDPAQVYKITVGATGVK
jgi:sugar lactone lactonase YvrE